MAKMIDGQDRERKPEGLYQRLAMLPQGFLDVSVVCQTFEHFRAGRGCLGVVARRANRSDQSRRRNIVFGKRDTGGFGQELNGRIVNAIDLAQCPLNRGDTAGAVHSRNAKLTSQQWIALPSNHERFMTERF